MRRERPFVMRMFLNNPNSVTRRAQSSAEAVSRKVLWVPLLVGGLVAAVLASRRSSLRSWIDRKFPARTGEGSKSSSLALLRDAILGNNKSAVAAVFGAPPATAGGFVTGHYHQADTWYYPLDKVEKSAMVIQFENGIARDAQFILAPQLD
jgi:hypothetical protein